MLRSLGMAAKKLTTMDYSATKMIVILGSTATGKTKLSVELAKLFDGEIISADSMQVYKGLDIITNKATAEEQQQVPHHLIDMVSPQEEFTVIDFKQQALDTISDLVNRNKVPIVVGGTNYFIESLLWDFLIEAEGLDAKQELQNRKDFVYANVKRKHTSSCEGEEEEEECSTKDTTDEYLSLHDRLMAVDPDRADQLHPNNVRKISRSLQIYHSTGHTHSSLVDKQHKQSGSSRLSGPLRFPKSLVFWLTAEQEVLDERISKRVDEMVHRGLLDEIRTFYESHIKVVGDADTAIKSENSNTSKVEQQTLEPSSKLIKSYEEGLFQAIGFKEFDPYLTYSGDGNDENTVVMERKSLLDAALGRLKQRTTRYSKKQVRWVQNRFLGRPPESSLPVYNLDVSDADKWQVDVLEKAKVISHVFMDDKAIEYEPYNKLNTANNTNDAMIIVDKHRRHICEDCDGRIIMGDHAWQIHLSSKRHKKTKASRAKRLEATVSVT